MQARRGVSRRAAAEGRKGEKRTKIEEKTPAVARRRYIRAHVFAYDRDRR